MGSLAEQTLDRRLQKFCRTEKEKKYVCEHRERFEAALNCIELATSGEKQRNGTRFDYLDIGPHIFTGLVQDKFDHFRVSTLGFEHANLYDAAAVVKHFEMDLNEIGNGSSDRALPQYDIVYMGELLEHLHCSPADVFGFLASLLADDGKLIIQTPNAVSLRNRMMMFVGRNPFGIRVHEYDHVREYTLNELLGLGDRAGLSSVYCQISNYFGSRRNIDRFALFSSLRSGITVVFEKVKAPRLAGRH